MKKKILSVFSVFLILSMLLGSLAACTPNIEDNTSDTTGTDATEIGDTTESASMTENDTEDNSVSSTESETESGTETETETDSDELVGPDASLIEHSNALANGVQAFFTDSNRTHYSMQNREMTMNYARSTTEKQLVESIKNTKGKSYIEQTMDVFIRMENGNTFYASNSSHNAEVNLYRFGYYYYQGFYEAQNFIPSDLEYVIEKSIKVTGFDKERTNNVSGRKDTDGMRFTVSSTNDPYFVYSGFSFDTNKYNALVITAKTEDIGSMDLFIGTSEKWFVSENRTNISLVKDGEFHTYYVPLAGVNGYLGNLMGLRFDPASALDGSVIIKEMKIVGADLSQIPQHVSINRQFHVYSDKMHQLVQFSTLQDTENVAEVGMITEVAADTVEQLIVVDGKGEHSSLDKVDWKTVQCVGFDIKDTGIFGYILPNDEIKGELKVTLEDGKYVTVQTRVPENNTLIVSQKDTKNANDFYFGQRIYTDENHDFEEFLFENYFEQNPLTGKNIKVSSVNSTDGSFAGYDAGRGIYVLNIGAPASGFGESYKNPQKHWKVNFDISAGDVARDIYIMTYTPGSTLECAALLNDKSLHLPVPIEVIKNFSEPSGERNLYNIDDPTFSEAIFPLTLDAKERYEYTILNLYQNWGNYPLKQLSQIPFHCPYYHLSTGTTETNCILPWFGTSNVGKGGLNTLPDFRSMSAPFWKGQPQHNSCGSHSWLAYTDADKNYVAVESIKNTITSYGPTYAELVWDNISDDGKISVTYTHMEMPQLDENRSYYTMEYTVLEDVTINDFKNNFQFYSVTDNEGTGEYQDIGYLNEKNEYAYAKANLEDSTPHSYLLGDQCPYFSYFNMGGAYNKISNPKGYSNTSAEGYSNVAFLIYNYDFNISTLTETPQFIITEVNNTIKLSLNLDNVTLKAGDTFKINAIALPWGSQELDNVGTPLTFDEETGTPLTFKQEMIDKETGKPLPTYDTPVDDAVGKYLDKNVRNVREDTLLNPLTVKSETDDIIESPFLPKVKSKDGKSAEFTLSGGNNNVTVRVYGFDMLTAPKIEEFVDGKWIPYEVNSASDMDNPAYLGYYHYYDGYGVYYDGDGTYSYSFVTTMNNGAPRKFRLSADTEVEEWPKEIVPEGNEDLLKVYVDAEELQSAASKATSFLAGATLSEDGKYTTIEALYNGEHGEGYASIYSGSSTAESGQYLVIKYRVPSTNPEDISFMEFYLSTVNGAAKDGDSFRLIPVQDGEWHVAVIDITKSTSKTFKTSDDGLYYCRYIRFDMFNRRPASEGVKLDVAYVGMDSSLEAICDLNAEDFDTITLYEGDASTEVDTESYLKVIKTYLDPSSGYTEADNVFGAQIDSINGKSVNKGSNSKDGITVISGAKIDASLKLTVNGWCAVEGGVSKYVWSADGGKTWNDCGNAEKLIDAGDAIMSTAPGRAGLESFADVEASRKNGSFQGSGLIIDLSAYRDKTVDVVLAAIPESDSKTLVLMFALEKIVCEIESKLDKEATLKESSIAYASNLDYASGVKMGLNATSLSRGAVSAKALTPVEDNKIKLTGWCVVNGGVSKYVWTDDGGKTWNDCIGTATAVTSGSAIVVEASKRVGTDLDNEASLVNVNFQGSSSISVDLSKYAGSTDPISIWVCAVPAADENSVCLLFNLTNISMTSELPE